LSCDKGAIGGGRGGGTDRMGQIPHRGGGGFMVSGGCGRNTRCATQTNIDGTTYSDQRKKKGLGVERNKKSYAGVEKFNCRKDQNRSSHGSTYKKGNTEKHVGDEAMSGFWRKNGRIRLKECPSSKNIEEAFQRKFCKRG